MSMKPMSTRRTLQPGESITICTRDEFGPENVVHIDQWGTVSVACEYQRIEIVSIDPGPGGIQIFVDGEHVDGSP